MGVSLGAVQKKDFSEGLATCWQLKRRKIKHITSMAK